MAATKSKKIRQANPEDREAKALRAIATATGLPDAQFDPQRITRIDTPQMPDERRTAHETVRKLTQPEMLLRKGLIEPQEAAACEWYAEAHALGYDTISCTANYDGAGGGSAYQRTHDLLARYGAQATAREMYAMARGIFEDARIPDQYVDLFESIVCENKAIGNAARRLLTDVKQSQGYEKAHKILKLCANRLHGGIAHLLEIKVAWKLDEPAKSKTIPELPAEATPRQPITAQIDAALDSAEAKGKPIGHIRISTSMLLALLREHEVDPDNFAWTFRCVDVVAEDRWPWGAMLMPGEPD